MELLHKVLKYDSDWSLNKKPKEIAFFDPDTGRLVRRLFVNMAGLWADAYYATEYYSLDYAIEDVKAAYVLEKERQQNER